MPNEEGPQIATPGAFGHPQVRPPDQVVDAGGPGIVAQRPRRRRGRARLGATASL
jgi:hypothetical protein